MNIATIKGRSSAVGHSEGEKALVSVFNLVGAEVVPGTPLCYSITASDGVSVVLPVIAANASNFGMLAGIAEDTIGTSEYCAKVVAKGIVSARVYGITTTLVQGANLALISTEAYVHYGSSGMFAGSTATGQPIVFTALIDHSTADTTLENVYINAL